MVYMFIPTLSLCLVNEPLESDPNATVGEPSEVEVVPKFFAIKAKHKSILTYYFIYMLNGLGYMCRMLHCQAIGEVKY